MKQWAKVSNGRPFLLKGIQPVDNAKNVVEYKCDGIVFSNHAGRQVDGAAGSLDMLPEIIDAVSDKRTILFGSGIRGNTLFRQMN
jgi:isopentenyl diphosphate isomerase/L-lactate dehydrogenase-like FMN-dependent dehydrogenase